LEHAIMAVSTGIPASWNLPLFWAVVDGTKAGNLSEAQRALLVGQYSATAGNAVANVPVPVGSLALAGQMFGVGSMLYLMVKAFIACNATQQLWAVPVADGTGAAATGSIAITAGTSSGLLTVYIAGQIVQVSVSSTDTAATIATNLAEAINSLHEMPVTASAATSTVTLTCDWKGLTGNDITIIPNYLGVYGGEAFPTGLSLVITAMTGGTGEPTFTGAISAIQSLEYDFVALPYTDAASMAAWNTEYGFGSGGRWDYTRQQYGMILNATRDTYANLLTWGLAQNAPVMSTMGVEQDSPTPLWQWSAAYCALAALGFSADPARPLQTLEFLGVLPARLQNRFSQAQLNALTNSGLAVQATDANGYPAILREQTQYQLNSFGQSDTAFGLLTVLATLQELLRRMKSAITSKYPRVKLIPDGTKIGPGQAAVTPTDIKAELIAEFSAAMYDGLVSNLAAFKANLIVEIDDSNPNKLNVLYPPQLAGQLRQFNALAQFRLLYPPISTT
jgi:phage tail sheath gpL-like